MLKIIHKAETYFIAATFGLMTFVIFLQVINRFIFKAPIMWPEEMARYLMVWMSFVAGAAAFRKRAHISVDVVTNLFKGKTKLVIHIIQSVLIVFFAAAVFYYSIVIIKMQLLTRQISPALEVNLGYIYLAIPVWGLLTFIEIFMLTKNKLTGN